MVPGPLTKILFKGTFAKIGINRSILRKLGLASRTEAALLALRLGLSDDGR